jgi:hypothetical protein
MTGQGRQPMVELRPPIDQQSLRLRQAAMPAGAARGERQPLWPKEDIVRKPVLTS